MRLSVKGIQKYTDHRVYYEYPIETLKFEPDDFEGAVVLTVEEAKLMLEALLRLPVEGNKLILKKTLIPLKGRIEQADGKK